jgi:uncharacterized protein involved in response to NO
MSSSPENLQTKPEPEGIPRFRPFDGPAILRQGFRPFFLCAGLWAVATIAVWLPVYLGRFSIPTAFDLVSWHVHEMLFGFVVAAVAGFLLTAIPNWTGRMPLQGYGLLGLVGVWALGRVAVATSAWIGAELAAIVDLSFLLLMLAVVLREIVAGRNWRNLPMPVAICVLVVANGFMHADTTFGTTMSATGWRLAMAIMIAMISLIGGRIIPSFTRNWLAKRGEIRFPAPFGMFDRLCLLIVVGALTLWIIRPDQAVSGAALMVAGAASLVRLARWRGHRTVSEPLVWSLHLGWMWVPAGLALLGASILFVEVPVAAGLHALTAGAFGSMILAVMTRATLGHTGQPLAADRWTTAIYVLVFLAAVMRVAAPFLAGAYLPLLAVSVGVWILAFALFTTRYGRLLCRS